MKITELLKQPESKTLEFKRDVSSLTPILKTVVAFANTAGGVLIVGKDSDGALAGIDDPFATEERLANAIADNIAPSLSPEIEIATIDGKDLLVVQVAHWKGPFYLKRQGIPQGVYVRLGSTSRPVNEDMLAEMQRQAAYSSYDQEPMPGLKEADIDFECVQQAFKKRSKGIDREKMLSLDLLTEFDRRLVPTIGGLILFGEQSLRQRYVPDARVSCARFKGNDKTYIIDRLELDCTILEAIDPVLSFISRNTRLGAEITSTHRIDIPEYPPIAVKEALINALVHADYTIKGSHTRISIFNDRLEIMNSGMLPFGYTLEDFTKGVSRVRNRVIARVFRELNLMEEWGSGYRRISSECQENGYLLPVWEESSTWILTTFLPHPSTTAAILPKSDSLTIRQQQILDLVTSHGPIAARDVMELIGEQISIRTLNRELTYLRSIGRVHSSGRGRATHWLSQ